MLARDETFAPASVLTYLVLPHIRIDAFIADLEPPVPDAVAAPERAVPYSKLSAAGACAKPRRSPPADCMTSVGRPRTPRASKPSFAGGIRSCLSRRLSRGSSEKLLRARLSRVNDESEGSRACLPTHPPSQAMKWHGPLGQQRLEADLIPRPCP